MTDVPHEDSQQAPREADAVPNRPPDETLHIGFDRAGTLRASYLGRARKGEDGSDRAAGALVFHLNKSGGAWSPLERAKGRERGVDFDSHGAEGTLAIQVTRVPHDQSRWERVHREGHVADVVDIPTAAQELFEAIRHKGGKSRPQGNADVTLVLDGSSSLVYMLENTLDRFEQEFGAQASALGFASIWLVTTTRIVRLAGR